MSARILDLCIALLNPAKRMLSLSWITPYPSQFTAVSWSRRESIPGCWIAHPVAQTLYWLSCPKCLGIYSHIICQSFDSSIRSRLQSTYESFIPLVFCLTTGPMPPPKRCRHIVRSRASSFKWEYPLLSLRSSSSFLRLLPRLLATSISRFIFPSITCFRRQFLRKMWPIQLAFRFLISCRIFLCSSMLV